MWLTFFACVAVEAAVLFVPGYLQIRALGFDRINAICVAPILSLFEYCVLGAVAGVLGVSVGAFGVVGSVVLVSAAVGIIRAFRGKASFGRKGERAKKRIASDALVLAAYLAFASLVTLYAYVMPLDGPESFAQIYDNAFHLNLVHAFMGAERFSVLQSVTSPTLPLGFGDDLSFYPAAWHVVTALCGSLMNVSAAMAENASNVVFVALVFPSAMFVFLRELFANNRAALLAGVVCTPAFVAFPWGFLVAGPLYANMAAFALLPAAMFLFMRLMKSEGGSCRAKLAALFLVACCTLVLAQPNALFTAMVVLAPFGVMVVYRRCRKNSTVAHAAIGAAIFAFCIVVFWVAVRFLPLFSGVVSYPWQPYVSNPFQGMLDYVILGDRNAVAQELLCGLVLAGIAWCFSVKRLRWLVFAYCFFGVAYLSAAWTHTGIIGTLLSGFWYNDVDRLAASAVFVMIPLACLGLTALSRFLKAVVENNLEVSSGTPVAVVALMVVLVLIYAPTYILPGHGEQSTAFGSRRAQAESLAHERVYLDSNERAFIDKCKKIIGDNRGVVINMPYDGSVFAYAECDLNTLYRHYPLGKSEDLKAIQQNLAGIAGNEQVQKAVESLGARYVLLLDSPEGEDSSVNHAFYNAESWGGILDVPSADSGFKLLLEDGDMRLYEIEQSD